MHTIVDILNTCRDSNKGLAAAFRSAQNVEMLLSFVQDESTGPGIWSLIHGSTIFIEILKFFESVAFHFSILSSNVCE